MISGRTPTVSAMIFSTVGHRFSRATLTAESDKPCCRESIRWEKPLSFSARTMSAVCQS